MFVRYRKAPEKTWRLVSPRFLRGSAHGLVDSKGHKKCDWWGIAVAGISDVKQVEFRVRALSMVRVPGGAFRMKTVLAGGHDASKTAPDPCVLPAFWMAKCETTIGMYADYLVEIGPDAAGWKKKMADENRCGIERTDNGTYRVLPGRANHPITYVSWYDAVSFLEWCGLRLPTETEFEKAFRGGLFLDGDATKKTPNPKPERRFPWGDEAPDAGGVHRCNLDGDADGFAYTAPVGSFSKFNSPYGICDLSGNVAEWTSDWYATSHHVGLDGFRMVRGGSWREVPDGVDADRFAFFRAALETIALARVATSAAAAVELGLLLPSDPRTADPDRQWGDAAATARHLAEMGYRPPTDAPIRVVGRRGIAAAETLTYNQLRARQMSQHDRTIVMALARVMSGGDVAEGTLVAPGHLLDLEREAFLRLLGEPLTRARIRHTLKTGKPLRN